MGYLAKGNLVISNFSDDTISIVNGMQGKEVKKILLNKPRELFPPEPLGPHHIALDHNRKYLYVTNSHHNSLSKIDLIEEKNVESTFVGSCPSQVVLCKKYRTLYVANSDSNSITVLDLNTLETLLHIPTDAMPHGMVLTRDQERLVIANRDAKTLTLVATATNQKLSTIPVPSHPWHLQISTKGDIIFVANYSHLNGAKGKIECYASDTMAHLETITLGSMPVELIEEGDTGLLYVTDSDLALVYIYHLAEKRVVKAIEVNPMPHGVAMDSERKLLYITSVQGNQVDVIDCRKHHLMKSIPVGKEPTSIVVI